MIVVVNLDPFVEREGLAVLPESLGFTPQFAGEELLGTPFRWRTGRNYVKLGPGSRISCGRRDRRAACGGPKPV